MANQRKRKHKTPHQEEERQDAEQKGKHSKERKGESGRKIKGGGGSRGKESYRSWGRAATGATGAGIQPSRSVRPLWCCGRGLEGVIYALERQKESNSFCSANVHMLHVLLIQKQVVYWTEHGFVSSFLFFGTPFVELIWFFPNLHVFLSKKKPYMFIGYVVCTGS